MPLVKKNGFSCEEPTAGWIIVSGILQPQWEFLVTFIRGMSHSLHAIPVFKIVVHDMCINLRWKYSLS